MAVPFFTVAASGFEALDFVPVGIAYVEEVPPQHAIGL